MPPPHWLAYAGVDDARAMTERVKALGGNVVQEVVEIGGHRGLSVLVDPTGGPLAMW
jgi:predicted enzyme related to lactoylglutathione lyase